MSIESYIAGTLVRPLYGVGDGVGLVVYTSRGELVLGPDDIGIIIIAYRNLGRGSILVLCRGELCQSSEYDWVPLRGGKL